MSQKSSYAGSSRACSRTISEGPTPADEAGAPGLPCPSGWSALAFSDELPPGTVLTRPLAGQDVVLYRLRSGGVHAVHPFCPHLGAHLGLAKVERDELVCPFHFFAFGPDGTCTRTGYGTPPPKTSLTPLPVQEVNGAVFVWRHHDGREPDWSIPQWHTIGHLPARHMTWELAGHSQEVIENSVDLGHFATLHGWSKAEMGGPVSYDKARFHVSMRAQERAPLLGDFAVEVEVDGYGMGCLHADVRTPHIGLLMCTMVMPTAITSGRMQFRQLNRIAFAEPRRLPRPLARSLSRTAARIMDGPVFRASCEFTAADFPIWHHKRYLQPPGLTRGDGPIGAFRHWARQFYPPREEAPGRKPSGAEARGAEARGAEPSGGAAGKDPR